MANSATTVLPVPTSPISSRCMRSGAVMSVVISRTARLVSRELEGKLLFQPGGELLLQHEPDPGPGPLREMAGARLHQLLIEELVEREAPPARLRLLNRAGAVHRRQRRAQLGDSHGG